jgi:hypothetical protein
MRYLLLLLIITATFLGCGDGDSLRKVKMLKKNDKEETHYTPSQPIEFSHDIHAGDSGIDCKYCHNSVMDSKNAGIPSVNVCMNCHKTIAGSDSTQQKEIDKIYDAAGWDGQNYSQKTKPIVWTRVQSLPDSIYFEHGSTKKKVPSMQFSHADHVKSEGIDCTSCHGNIEQPKTTIVIDENFCSKCHY